jgi:hypothetical protein
VITVTQGKDPNVTAAENLLRSKYRAKVKINQKLSGSGEIKFTFTNQEELDALIEKLSSVE